MVLVNNDHCPGVCLDKWSSSDLPALHGDLHHVWRGEDWQACRLQQVNMVAMLVLVTMVVVMMVINMVVVMMAMIRAALYGPKPEYTELDLDDKDCVNGNWRCYYKWLSENTPDQWPAIKTSKYLADMERDCT